MSENISELTGRKGINDNLFDRYGQLSKENGSPDKEELAKLAEEFLIGHANTYGAVTFYDFLKPENRGKKVYICNGSVCLCAGTQPGLKEKILSHFPEEEIGEMCCLGRCHENTAFHYDGHNYSGSASGDLSAIFDGSEIIVDKYNIGYQGTQILTGQPEAMSSRSNTWNKVLSQTTEAVLKEIKASGLRGRGGAGFPMGTKLQFCGDQDSDTKFIICNADEGDPGAFSDRYLLEHQPHQVLLGMMIAGYACGARWGVVYIRGEYPESVQKINEAIRDFRENNLIGADPSDSSFAFHFKVIQAQGSYICGEETALLNSIEGQRPEVNIRPPYPAVEGLFNKPTVVSNVETLAALPYILEKGGQHYHSIGTESSSGTKLISLDSHFVNPGIYEVEMGTPLEDLFIKLGGGYRVPIKAFHIGGPLGGLVPMSKVSELNISFESFQQHGFLLGHASVVCIPEDFEMVEYLEHLFEFAAYESCGKCFPCRLGTKRAQEMLTKAKNGSYQIDRELFDDLLHTLEEGSLCAHGGGIPLPVRNAMIYFQEELSPYFT